jgi:hypothetical protein
LNTKGNCFLDELYVTETARGKSKGISSSHDFIKAESHKLSLKLIYLEVEPHNIQSAKFVSCQRFEMHNRKLMRLKSIEIAQIIKHLF